MSRNRKAKILATLGPASSSPNMIARLHKAGVDAFRLNFSHGLQTDHEKRLAAIRKLEAKTGTPITALMDLQGPKLRVGTFPESKQPLQRGQAFALRREPGQGDSEGVHLPHPEIFDAVEVGQTLLVDDGKLRLEITAITLDAIETKVMAGSMISDRKGVNLPDTVLKTSPLTPKDRDDLDFGLSIGVDWVALSFVQHPDDIREAQDIIQGRARLMAKIEKPSAIQHIDEIIALSDGIMVARGDLGVEMPPEDVPHLQKDIIRRCRKAGKPVVVATQMLESMITAPTPTRAEASDVATAVYEGADAVMLSAESAAGQYPLEAVSMMDRIIARTEASRFYQAGLDALEVGVRSTGTDAISDAAARVALSVEAKLIVTHTRSGNTALRAARERPSVPIICVTPAQDAARQLSLVWGLHCVHTDHIDGMDQLVEKTNAIVQQSGLMTKGERYVLTAGVPFGKVGMTNMVRIVTL
jgi:pyruvate kinase